MKNFSLPIIGFLFVGCSACSPKTDKVVSENKTQQPAQQSSTIAKSDSVKTNTADPNNSRFIVSFYSIGEGIEGSQVEKFDTFLMHYRQLTGKNIPAEKTPWGREGEVDYCINLSEFSPSDQTKFIADSKEELKTARWVNFSENSPCRQKRR